LLRLEGVKCPSREPLEGCARLADRRFER
jgi:hypothetical protein